VLWLDGALDGVERVDGEIQSGVKPPHSKNDEPPRCSHWLNACPGMGEALKPFSVLKIGVSCF
jgi:hypothetical protein